MPFLDRPLRNDWTSSTGRGRLLREVSPLLETTTDSLQAGWWYSGFGGGPNFQGPNNGITFGPGKLFLDDPCVITKGTFGPGRLDNPCDRYHLWSLHSGGANFLFADGSVQYLSYAAEPLMIPLATRSGGEVVDPF